MELLQWTWEPESWTTTANAGFSNYVLNRITHKIEIAVNVDNYEKEDFILFKVDGTINGGENIYSNVIDVPITEKEGNTVTLENIPAGCNITITPLQETCLTYTFSGEQKISKLDGPKKVSFKGTRSEKSNMKIAGVSALKVTGNYDEGFEPETSAKDYLGFTITQEFFDWTTHITLSYEDEQPYFIRAKVYSTGGCTLVVDGINWNDRGDGYYYFERPIFNGEQTDELDCRVNFSGEPFGVNVYAVFEVVEAIETADEGIYEPGEW